MTSLPKHCFPTEYLRVCVVFVSRGLIVSCEGNAVGARFQDRYVLPCSWILQPFLGRALLESIHPCLIAARAQSGHSVGRHYGKLGPPPTPPTHG